MCWTEFDEVELIGRYSLLQRGRSYAELARWLGDGQPEHGTNEWDLIWLDPAYRPSTEVVEITSDYTEDAALDDNGQ